MSEDQKSPDFPSDGESPEEKTDEETQMEADAELSAILSRRCEINEKLEEGQEVEKRMRSFNPHQEFPEFSRQQLKEYEVTFRKYDTKRDGVLDLMELKKMMQSLGAPQTHLALKEMIAEVDEDQDGMISYREFLLIFRKAAADELSEDSGLQALAKLTEVDVHKVGVGGAKNFFEAKIQDQTLSSRFEAEIKQEQEERRLKKEQAKQRKQDFLERAKFFEQAATT